MAPLAHLLLAACALAAPLHAASLSEKKVPVDIKEPLGADHGHELADLQEPVKEIDNELRAKLTDTIPVAVVVENAEPPVKINEVDEDETRPPLDLRNPGPPQRQEHETQNPEQHSDQQIKVSTIKDNIERVQIVLKKSFQDVADDIKNWMYNNEDQTKIQQNIQKLRDTFGNQIQKLNDTLQALGKPDESKPAEMQGEASETDLQKVGPGLKIVEENFNNGVDTFSAGVNLIALLKSQEESEISRQQSDESVLTVTDAPAATLASSPPPSSTAPPAAAPPATSSPQIGIVQQFNLWVGSIMDQLNNVTQPFRPNRPSSTSPPQEIQNDPVNGVSASPPQSSQPSFQLPTWPNLNPFNINWPNPLQNWPFSSNNSNSNTGSRYPWQTALNNWINRPSEQTTAAPILIPAPGDKPAETHSDQPAQPAQPATITVAAPSPPAASPAPPQAEGPIRQFLNNNPIAQRITSTVQQLQNTINNTPERVRDPVEKSDSLSAKGGGYGKPGGSGDNNDSGLRAEEIKEPIQEEPKKEAEAEVKPEVVSEKTE